MSPHLSVLFERERATPDAMATLIDAFDWRSASTGPFEDWPEPVRCATRTALLSVTAMAVLVGREGLAVYNDAACEMFGLDRTTALGRPFLSALPDGAALCRDAIEAARDGRSSRLFDRPLAVKREGKAQTCWFRMAFTPLVDQHGGVQGVLVIATETTDRIHARLQRQAADHRLALTAGPTGLVGTWDFDVATNRITINPQFATLYGLPQEEEISDDGPDALLATVHPEDRGRVVRAIRETLREGTDYHCQYRAIGVDGAERFLLSRGRPIRDGDGAIRAISGVIIDMTEKLAAQEALAESRMRFDTLADAMPHIVWSADHEGRCDYFNNRWSEFTGLSAQYAIGAAWLDHVAPEDRDDVRSAWRDCLKTGAPYDVEYRLRHRNGAYRWLRSMATPMRDDSGRVMRWFGASTDIHDAKALAFERGLVSRELDHRIKNLFAVVNGLLSLSVRNAPEFAPAADDLRVRLRALHDAHRYIRADPLSDTMDDSAATLNGLITALLAPYVNSDARVKVEGDDVAVKGGDISAFALIVHELATNSAKYGALADGAGRLRVAIRKTPGGAVVRWREQAARIGESAADRPGFGSRLLKLTVETHLGGSLTRRQRRGGMNVTIAFPHDTP